MENKREYLCVILDRQTKVELASYTIVLAYNARFWGDPDCYGYHRAARFQASIRFESEFPEFKSDNSWYVDSCLMPE